MGVLNWAPHDAERQETDASDHCIIPFPDQKIRSSNMKRELDWNICREHIYIYINIYKDQITAFRGTSISRAIKNKKGKGDKKDRFNKKER